MPGISSRRSRGSDGGRRRRRGRASGSAPRSSLGARLRTRWPQYGHSVTYMLTSEPQFLQTTNSSASLTVSEDTPGRPAPSGAAGVDESGAAALRRGLVDDLPHDLAQVVVRLVDDDLAGGPVAALEQVIDRRQLALRAELLGVPANALDHAPGQLLGPHAVLARQVDQLAVEPVPRGEPIVLV